MGAVSPDVISPYLSWLFQQLSPTPTATPTFSPPATPTPGAGVTANLTPGHGPRRRPTMRPRPDRRPGPESDVTSSVAGAGNTAMNMPSYEPVRGRAEGGPPPIWQPHGAQREEQSWQAGRKGRASEARRRGRPLAANLSPIGFSPRNASASTRSASSVST